MEAQLEKMFRKQFPVDDEVDAAIEEDPDQRQKQGITTEINIAHVLTSSIG